MAVKRTMFPHWNIQTYTWTSPDGKTQNQIHHILTDRRWHSSILDVWSFRGADCVNDHCPMVAEGRERLAVSKRAAQKLDVERYNIRKPNELEIRKQDQIKISNRCTALENSNNSEDINRACENTEGNIRMSAKDSLGLYELKQHKPWFDEEY